LEFRYNITENHFNLVRLMKPSDLVGLDYKMKHAKSKKAVIKTYPELEDKTIAQVQGLISVNTMILTGKDFKEQKRNRLRKKSAILMKRKSNGR
jgi:hypothetical protein